MTTLLHPPQESFAGGGYEGDDAPTTRPSAPMGLLGVTLREASPADAEGLRRMFYRLSLTSIFRWLAVGAPHTPHFAERLAAYALEADGNTHTTLVAQSGEALIGVACYVLVGDRADVAIVIEDAWQERRLGTWLAQHLLRLARERGVPILVADLMAENRRALRLARRLAPNAHATWDQGTCHLEAMMTFVRERLETEMTLLR